MKIMIVAGEASGDKHAASLVHALRSKIEGSVEVFGSAGPLMREAGVEAVVEADDMSVVGVAEIAIALPKFLRAFRTLVRTATHRLPDLVILVDYPEFNLKLARKLKRKGFRIVYYISPQVWAWRKYRVEAIKKYVDLMLTILPFEQQWFARHGYDRVKYVGNPLAREVHAERTREEFAEAFDLDPGSPIVALLPGSRHKEISRILPVMLAAAGRLILTKPDLQLVIPVRCGRNREDAEQILGDAGMPTNAFRIIEDSTYDAVAASDAAVVTSGTATLETGILGTPMVIVYKTSGLNYRLLRPLVSVDQFGLINLIAGSEVAKELLQHEFTAEAVCREVLSLLEPGRNREVREQLRAAGHRLGEGGASERAADAILDFASGTGQRGGELLESPDAAD